MTKYNPSMLLGTGGGKNKFNQLQARIFSYCIIMLFQMQSRVTGLRYYRIHKVEAPITFGIRSYNLRVALTSNCKNMLSIHYENRIGQEKHKPKIGCSNF